MKIAKIELLANSDLASRTNQTLPLIRNVTELARQENLDSPTEKIARCRILRAQRLGSFPAPPAIEPRWKHPRIVQNQQVIRAQQVGKFAELAILPSSIVPSQVQHPRGSAIGRRLLRDALRRQVIIEIGNKHRIWLRKMHQPACARRGVGCKKAFTSSI